MVRSCDITNKDFVGNLDHILINLKIISSIEINDKLTFKNKNLIIDSSSVFQGVKRWWNSSDRHKSLIEIQNIIEKVKEILKQLNEELEFKKKLLSKPNKSSISDHKEEINLINEYITNFKAEMPNIINGLANLRTTYTNDTKCTSKIDYLIELVRNIIK